MSTAEPHVIRAIQWRAIFPWTLIFRAVVPAVSLAALLFGTLGTMLTSLGWRLSEMLFVNDALRAKAPGLADFAERMRSPWQGIFESYQAGESLNIFGAQINGPLLVFGRMVEPFIRLFEPSGGLGRFAYLSTGIVLMVLIWSFAGTAITRLALYRLARQESLSLAGAWQYACREGRSAGACVLVPLAGVAVLGIPAAIIGLLMSFDAGLLVAGLLYGLVLLLGIGMAILMLGLAFGWPLAIAAVSAEGQGFFDGLTRSFAYTFQRPFSYAFYALIAVLAGGLAWVVINRTTVGVERLTDWSASWGANVAAGDRMESIGAASRGELAWDFLRGTPTTASSPSWAFRTGSHLIFFWKSLLRTVAVGFLFAQYWCLAAAVYLLLRKQVDDAEMDELFVAEEQRTYDLPVLEGAATTTSNPPATAAPATRPGSLADTVVPATKPATGTGSDDGPQIDTEPEA